MKEFFCSADEYENLRRAYNGKIQMRNECLRREPGTAQYEEYARFEAEAKVYTKALEAFAVQEGSERSPDGNLILSPQFQRDLDVFLAELRGDHAAVEEAMARDYLELCIEYGGAN